MRAVSYTHLPTIFHGFDEIHAFYKSALPCYIKDTLRKPSKTIRKETLNMSLNILLIGLAVLLVVVGIVSKVSSAK